MKLLTLPFCVALFVILKVCFEGMFVHIRSHDGEACIIANNAIFYWLKYDMVVSHLFIVNNKCQMSFQQQSSSRNEQQVNFLFWILPLACFWSIRTIKRIRNTVFIIWQTGLGVRLSKEIEYWYHPGINVWNKQIFYGGDKQI